MSLQIRTAEEIQQAQAAALKDRYRLAADKMVEDCAKAMGYNGAASAAGYVTSSVPKWRQEAEAFVAWRDSVWTAVSAVLETVDASNPPTLEQFLQFLPVWEPPL